MAVHNLIYLFYFNLRLQKKTWVNMSPLTII